MIHDLRHKKLEIKTKSLGSRPKGTPTKGVFQFTQTDVAALQQGEVLLKDLHISVYPYRRRHMSEAKPSGTPYEVGKPILGGVVAEVVENITAVPRNRKRRLRPYS